MINSKKMYEKIAGQIIASLEKGVAPWIKPWTATGSGVPMNFTSKKAYRGINVPLLWIAAQSKGYATDQWLTFRQALELGANVRKGEKATEIYFYKKQEYKKKDDQGKETGETGSYPLLRVYFVFNVAQCDGLKLPKPEAQKWMDDKAAEKFLRSTGADVRHGGDRAYYSPDQDFIQMPQKAAFKDAHNYYAVRFHETTHWTGHKSRCARDLGGVFGMPSCAKEELVAEIGAAFLCAKVGYKLEGVNHPAYIQHWLKVLGDDPKFVMQAASMAQKAVDFLTGVQFEQQKAA